MNKIPITIITLFIFANSFAQKTISVNGKVKTEDGKGLSFCTVSLFSNGFIDTVKTITDEKGHYFFKNVSQRKYIVTVSHIGYKKFIDTYDYTLNTSNEINGDILMQVGNDLLETVNLESAKIYVKEDTISFRIDSAMYRKNDNVAEVLKKLPGIEVDKDGKVTSVGREVKKVKVNGKEFFGGDVKTAIQQLNADMIEKIQIIEDYGDQAAFTGVKEGEASLTMNIQLKKNKTNGVFGNIAAGVGTEKTYSNNVILNHFNSNHQISFVGNLNNANVNTFNFSGLGNALGALSRGLTTNSITGSDGISNTKSIGFNYRTDLSKKVKLTSSYSFSKKATTLIKDIFIQYPTSNPDSTNYNKPHNADFSVNDNHRLTFNIEYTIDSFNFIKFSPIITYRNTDDNYRSDMILYNNKLITLNEGYNTNINNSTSPNFSGSLLYNHSFVKKGRTFSVNFLSGKSTTNREDDIYNKYTRYDINGNPIFYTPTNQYVIQQNGNYNYGVNTSFREQLSKERSLEINYAYNKKYVGNDKKTYDLNYTPNVLLDRLTNNYENIYTTNRIGFNLKTTFKKYNYTIGFALQPAHIESNSFTSSKISYKQSFINFFPVARFVYNFAKGKSLTINYTGSTNQPTYQQSQPIADVSNLLNTIIGNPNLKPEFSNTISIPINYLDVIKGNGFFANFSTSFVKDKIINNVTRNNFGIQETRYLNTNGFYNINATYGITKSINKRKYVFNYGGSINYNNNISYLSSIKNNGNNWLVMQRFATDYKIKKWLETSAAVNFSLNDIKNSINTKSNSTVRNWFFSHSSKLYFKYDFIFSYDIEKYLYSGYSNNVASNPFLINSSLEKQFFKTKKASLKFQAFDILNQNVSISRVINSSTSSITDTKTNRLQRYFMVSIIYRINKFKGSANRRQSMQTMPGVQSEVRILNGQIGL